MKNSYLGLASWFILSIILPSCDQEREHFVASEKTIASLSIRHATPKLVQDRRLLPLISSQPGSFYSQEKIDHDIKSLWESGLVENAAFEVKSDGTLIHLVASLSTSRPFGPVLLRGNKSFSTPVLWKQISKPLADRIIQAVTVVYDLRTDEPMVHKDERLLADVLPAVSDELQNFYRSKGFQDVKVRAVAWNGGPPTINDFGFVIDEQADKN